MIEGATCTPLRGDFGCVVQSQGRDLIDLDVAAVAELFARVGTLLFRGFRTDVEHFRIFSDRMGMNYRAHSAARRLPAVEDPTGTIQTVELLPDRQPPHAELRWTPFAPELVWFFCVRPSLRGGETILYDGVQYVAALSEATRAVLSAQRVTYSYYIPGIIEDWHKILDAPDVETATQRLEALDNSRYGGEHKYGFRGETLVIHYSIPFFTPTRFSDRPAFAGSVLSGYGRAVATFEDKTPIGDDLRKELNEVARKVEVPLAWQPGDLAMIDNTRVMHGRDELEPGDNRRLVLSRFGDCGPPFSKWS